MKQDKLKSQDINNFSLGRTLKQEFGDKRKVINR